MRKLSILILLALLMPFIAIAASTVHEPVGSVIAEPVAGKSDDGSATPLRVNSSGSLLITESNSAPTNGNVNISSAGITARTQMPTLTASSCLVSAHSGNAGAVYVGGSTVTNAAGANPGIPLSAGTVFSNIAVSNLNQIYVSTDNANDDVAYFCN